LNGLQILNFSTVSLANRDQTGGRWMKKRASACAKALFFVVAP
jgi:hypothetical protein